MLESRGLIVGPWVRFAGNNAWRHAALPGAWTRSVRDAASGAELGFAAFLRAGQGPLASWFGRRRINVFETEDASFLMSLRRGFWRLWEVFDAEEKPVGSIARSAVSNVLGENLATVRNGKPSEPGTFLTRGGQSLARFSRSDATSWLVTFPELPQSDPFARMVILAAVLSWGPEPG